MVSKISMNSDENEVDIGTPFSSSYLKKLVKKCQYQTEESCKLWSLKHLLQTNQYKYWGILHNWGSQTQNYLCFGKIFTNFKWLL